MAAGSHGAMTSYEGGREKEGGAPARTGKSRGEAGSAVGGRGGMEGSGSGVGWRRVGRIRGGS